MTLTVERLSELFEIVPEAGSVVWKNPPRHHSDLLGKEAGTTNKYGYIQIRIDGRFYRRARLMWLYVHGVWPAVEVDHENLIKTDDRIGNLREATHSQNICNAPRYQNNTSGVKGIDWHIGKRRWRARIAVCGKRTTIGYYQSLDQAVAARDAVLSKYHGEFARAA